VAEAVPTVNQAPTPAGFAPLAGEEPYIESGWAEFSGMQAPNWMPADAGAAPPPVSPAPGNPAFPGNYPYAPGSMLPGFMPPVTPAPKRRRPMLAVAIILGVLVLLLVAGGVFLGISIGQSHNVVTGQTTVTATAGASQDASQLYRQVTSQTPAFVDSLQDATLSTWAMFEKPTYGCHIESDGLHLYIKDTGRFIYCTSGRGNFSNFAFQVEMKLLSGAGGGITFRGDTLAGNFYYFHVYPDGSYHIYISQNHKLTTELGAGTIGSFAAGFGQKNTLTVIAQGSQLYFYVNQKFLTKLQNATYTGGYVGVLVSDITTPAEVVYTNAQIWNI